MAAPIWQFVNGVLHGPTISPTAVLSGDGSASAPSYSFASDPDTGIYRINDTAFAFSVGGSFRGKIDSLGYFTALAGYRFGPSEDVILLRDGAANTLALRNGANAQTFRVGPSGNLIELIGAAAGAAPYLQGIEGTAPASAPANSFRLFAQDNGAGKTQLMVIFGSGAAQQIAIEP